MGLKTVVVLPIRPFRLYIADLQVLHEPFDIRRKLRHIHYSMERIMETLEQVALTGCTVGLDERTNVHINLQLVLLCLSSGEKGHYF